LRIFAQSKQPVMQPETTDIEQHPLQPFLPPDTRLLMLGSFPPPRRRWAMDFFYPNFSNQMWQIFGLVFFGDSQRLIDAEHKTFRLDDIKALLTERGIAIYDTACAVRRLSGNASDKDLEIIEKTDIPALLSHIPHCHDIVCTGQKSFSVLTEDYGVPVPQMGTHNDFTLADRAMHLWRMPSSSRAYPMKLEDKAAYYREMMAQIGLL
jgi:G:T/U-mismatch repair DNA glycosylase